MIDAAIVGMGSWGRTLVDSVQGKSQLIRFVAGATGTPAKVADYAKEKGIRLHVSYADVLADPAVKVVVLATPHSQHSEQVIAAARSGRHIFVEKPFTLTKASAEAAVAVCRETKRVMALGHNRRFLPAVAEIKRMIAAGELGTLCHIEGTFSGSAALNWKPGMWRASPEESPAGGMGGLGVHILDMFINLGGALAEVSCWSHARVLANGIDDTTAMLLRFRSGMTGTLHTYAATARIWRLQLFGSKGSVEMRGDDTLVKAMVDGGAQTTQSFPATDMQRAELEAFAAACAGGPPYPLPWEQAVHGVSAYETLIASAKAGGRTLPIP
ncbi:MAG: Gfo/Idh/MocA family oxidoreductase [Alphaproteobacteria bacterium]|nr:Gfo/Idh/MocA family oxidoreductase [Alphaproteobacteria bacterium]